MPELGVGKMRTRLSFAQTFAYTRADCPRYGELKGPSCYTAPLVRTSLICRKCCSRRTISHPRIWPRRRVRSLAPTATWWPWVPR